MAVDPEEILDDAVNRREVLQLGRRLEAPHLPFPLSRWLMRYLGPESISVVAGRGTVHPVT